MSEPRRALELLLPRPRHAALTGDGVERAAVGALPASIPEQAEAALGALRAGLAELPGVAPATVSGGAAMRVGLAPAGGPEAYRLRLAADGVELAGSDAAGLFYGVQTLLQWLRLHPPDGSSPLPGLEVHDAPGFRHRGYLLDVSRNRVPTTASLFALVDRLAELKLNQLQLYTEHTFAYPGHQRVWADASPLAGEEIRSLDAYCRRRFVELVPNQNSFGHLHRWLVHEPYRRLAECPEGVEHPFGERREPFSLCPTDPAAIDFLAELYELLLPHFRSRQFNVGLDETFDVGLGRSAAAVAEHGKAAVYLGFLRRVHELVGRWGHRMQFWGDALAEHPELVGRLPADATPLEWGYEAGHPFAERCRPLAEAGLDFYVCPGTSAWNSLGGRLDNALANLTEAASAGRETGAAGYLITDWGDFGHLQPPPVSWPGLAAGAACAWSPSAGAPAPGRLGELLDLHFAAGCGAALVGLGGVYRATGVTPANVSMLFRLLLFADRPLDDRRFAGLSAAGLERARAASGAARQLAGGVDGLPGRELRWVAEALVFLCELGLARLAAGRDATAALPGRSKRRLREELGRLVEALPPLWLARSRTGGLRDSLARLEALGRRLG